MANRRETLRTGDWLTRERIRLVALAVLVASVLGAAFLIATSWAQRPPRPPARHRFLQCLRRRNLCPGRRGHRPLQPAPPVSPASARSSGRRPSSTAGITRPFSSAPPPVRVDALPAGPGAVAGRDAGALSAGHSRDPRHRVTPGLVPAIHDFSCEKAARHGCPAQAGHDGAEPGIPGGKLWLLLALAYPAVVINLGHGQNGFLTAALLGAPCGSSTAGHGSPAC